MAEGVCPITRTGSSALRARTQKPLRGFRAAAAGVMRPAPSVMIEIDTKPTRFYSQLDEDSFFSWAEKIECIVTIEALVISIDPTKVDDINLRDTIALLYRYGLPMRQLAKLVTKGNSHWFKNKEKYWYGAVFSDA